MVFANIRSTQTCPQARRVLYSEYQRAGSERRAWHLCLQIGDGHEGTRLALDRGIYVAQEKHLSGEMAEQVQRSLGALLSFYKVKKVQDVSRCGPYSRGKLGRETPCKTE